MALIVFIVDMLHIKDVIEEEDFSILPPIVNFRVQLDFDSLKVAMDSVSVHLMVLLDGDLQVLLPTGNGGMAYVVTQQNDEKSVADFHLGSMRKG